MWKHFASSAIKEKEDFSFKTKWIEIKDHRVFNWKVWNPNLARKSILVKLQILIFHYLKLTELLESNHIHENVFQTLLSSYGQISYKSQF